MTANESVMVPAGTIVSSPNNTIVTINGSSNTIKTQVGSIVNVPASATGPANNVVTTGQTSSGGISTSALTVTGLAGSATMNASPRDGTGASAIFGGGGHMAVDSAGNIIVSDQASLRKVTQAGVVTTLAKIAQPYDWEGVAIDPAGNIYGSGATTPRVMWGASVFELTASGALQSLFTNWEIASNPSAGMGGLAVDSTGNLFQTDGVINNRIIKFPPTGNWTVFAGSSTSGNLDGVGTSATFSFDATSSIAIDSHDFLYVFSYGAIRKIAPDGTVTTIASKLPYSSDAIAVDPGGDNIYIAGLQTIYRVTQDGSVTSYKFPNTTDYVTSMAMDKTGNLYVGTRGTGAQIFKITF